MGRRRTGVVRGRGDAQGFGGQDKDFFFSGLSSQANMFVEEAASMTGLSVGAGAPHVLCPLGARGGFVPCRSM